MVPSDEQLISDYLDGNENALESLVDRHMPAVYHFAIKLVHDGQVAHDITQQAFIKAWKNIRGFRQQSNFHTWLFTITRNVALDYLRQKKPIALSAFENTAGVNHITETLADDGPLPQELLAHIQDTAAVQKLIEELDPMYRDVLTLRYDGYNTFEEIAQVLKKPLHTVKSQHRRALIALRRSWETKPL